MNETISPGPASRAPTPVMTKMPAPMIAPMPSAVRSSAPSARRGPPRCGPASSIRVATGLRRISCARRSAPSPPLTASPHLHAASSPGLVAAVHGQHRAGYIARRLASQKDYRSADFLGPPEPSKRRRAFHPFAIVALGDPALGGLGRNPSGRERVDQDSMAGPFDRELAGEIEQPGLGRGVRREPVNRTGDGSVDRNHVDDAAGTFGLDKAAGDALREHHGRG